MAFEQLQYTRKKRELVDELSKKEVRVRTVSQLPPVFHSSHFLIFFFASVSVYPTKNIPNLCKKNSQESYNTERRHKPMNLTMWGPRPR